MGKIFTTLFFIIVSFTAFSQTVSFTYAAANGGTTLCSPAVVNFTPVSSGNLIGYTWYFGNGQTSNSAIPSMAYTTGTYVVKLVAVFSNAAIETSQTIVVNPGINANFSGNRNYICKLDTVGFNCITATPNATFLYDFADGSAPVSTNSSSVVHNFTAFGLYNTSVLVTNTFGCTFSDNFFVDVKPPIIISSASPVNGCAPVSVTFGGTIVDVPPGSSVTNYAWSFNDGSAISNTASSGTTHPYNDSGTFSPTLTITTIEGCTNTFIYPSLFFGLAPTILYTYPKKTTFCASEIAAFVANSDFATSYKWAFGDGAVQFTADTLISHKYNSLGIKTVTVTPINNACFGQPFTFTVNVIGVIASYNYANTCGAKNTFSFTNTSQGNQSFKEWIFGDGSPNVYTTNATHTYPPSGTFNTMLIVADNITGCRDSIQYVIYTATPTLLNPDSFVCRNALTTFTILNNYPSPSLTGWSVLGTPDNNTINPFIVKANAFGNFSQNFVVIFNGTQYCPDTVRLNKTIRVGGPNLSYNTDTSFCTNNNFVITNTSSPYLANDTIKTWNWTFGIPNLTDTSYQPAVFVYSAEGTYQIKLIARDKTGCSDTLIKNILVKESPFLRIFPRTAQICSGQTVTLTGYYTDTLVWAPASLVSCATCDTTIATPVNSTKIYAIASNPNCSLKDSAIITVYEPFTAVATTSSVFACRNETVNLFVFPTDKKVVWSPVVGLNNSTIYNPVVTVLGDANYLVTLTDSAGCYSSDTTIAVRAYPQPVVNTGPDRILSYNSPFTISPVYSSDVTSYLWSPANNLNCSNCPRPSGNADSTRTFFVTVKNANNCIAKDTISISIECAYANLYMASAFSPDNITVKKYYYPQTRGIKMINRFAVFNRYGEVIYEIKNALPNIRNNGWDGKLKGIDQMPGGYVYMLDATCEKGELLNKKGSFLLIR